MGAAGVRRPFGGALALLWLLLAAQCGAAAATAACAGQIDASGPYDKSNDEFTFDVLAAADINVSSFAVRLLNASRSQAVLTVSFKEEGWASNTLAWQPVAAVRNGWFEGVSMFTLSQPLRAGVQSSFWLQSSVNPIRYNFQPYLDGVQTAVVTDGALSILPGMANNRIRYFAGYVGYALNTPACASVSAPPPPPSPPPSTFTLPTLPAGSVYVYSEADLLAAIADATVTHAVLAASFRLSGSPVSIPSSSTLVSISGNAQSCALAAVGSPPPVDYDYTAYIAPVYSPLSSAVCTIDGTTASQILVVDTPHLALSNLQLINGWAFGNAGESGGAVFMSDAATPAACNSLLEVDGCVFAGDSAYDSGGGVFACNATVSNSLFRNNYGQYGGDLYVVASLNVESSVFMQGFAYYSGGSIYLDAYSRAPSNNISDSIFSYEGGFSLSVTATSGGAIYTTKATQHTPALVLTNVSIDAYSASQGGGIFAGEYNTVVLRGCSVTRCSASDGGGIYLSVSSWLFLLDTAVANNTSVGGGGGISVHDYSSAVAMSSTAGAASGLACAISGNAAGDTGQGGGVYISALSNFWVAAGCSITGNSAQIGGGVYIVGGNAGNNIAYAANGLDFLSASLFSAAADDPGWAVGAVPSDLGDALYASVSWGVYAESATISGNAATQAGGGIYCGTDGLCGMENTVLADNTAGTSGGGLFAMGAAQAWFGTLIATGNVAGEYGGALFMSDVPLGLVASSLLTGNSASVGGGALYAIGTTAAVNDTAFSANAATGVLPRGGAVYLRDASAFVFSNCTLSSNAASSSSAESSAVAGEAQLVEPFGAFEGGALSFVAASEPVNVTLVGCTVANNAATEGGAVAAQGSAAVNLRIAGTAFAGNTAVRGGVFSLGDTTNTSLDSCSITSNSAELGAVFVVTAVDRVPATASSVLSNNTALNYGPAAATLPVNWTLAHPTAARTGSSLPLEVRLYDLFSQQVMYWKDAVVQTSAGQSQATLLSGATQQSYSAGAATFTDLIIHGTPERAYPVIVTVNSPSLTLQVPASQALNITIADCNFAEKFNPASLSCECVEQATYDADAGACVCGFGFYMNFQRAVCTSCPESGAFCPGNNYAYPLENYWHVPYNWTTFYECEQHLCLALVPTGDASRSNCREAHTGLLCTSCVDGATYQGQFCSMCAPGTAWSEWSRGKQAAFLIGFIVVVLLLLCVLLLPLSKRIHSLLLGYVSATYAVVIRGAYDRVVACFYTKEDTEADTTTQSRAIQVSEAELAAKKRNAQIEKFLLTVQRVGEPVRLVIDQIQIMSSFTQTMRIDWPPIFFSVISVLDVVNFNFLQLPSTACMSPRISYFTYFLGICLGFSCGGIFLWTLWAVALLVARKQGVDEDSRQRFTDSCLSIFILALSVAYTPVAEAIMGVFGCQRIEDTYWLVSDLREQCYTPRHYLYYKIAVFFLIIFVFGIPCFYVAIFYHFNIPQTVKKRKRDARVRALVQYGFSQQMQQPACNPLKITERDISDEHVNALYTELFRRASDFRKHATRELRFTRAELHSRNHRVSGISEAEEAPSPRASEMQPAVGGDGDGLDSKPLDAAPSSLDFTLRLRQSLSERLVSAAKRTAKAFFVNAVSTLSGNEAPHIAASQVHELSRNFKLRELLAWSEVHLHAPPMRWAHHEIVDCIEHLYAHLFCEHWYWELVELLRKFLFACVVGFINPGSSSQIAAATTLSFLFLQLYLYTRPYSGKRTRLVASYAYFSLLAFFFIALLLKQKISVSSGNDKLVFSVLVGALTVGAFSTPVLVFLESLRRVRFKNRYMEQYR